MIQNKFSLKTGLLVTLVTEQIGVWAVSREFMASRAGEPAWVQSLPCILEFLAELSWSLLPALWTFGLQPQLEHAGCGIQHNLSQSPAHKHVAALQCGWPHIACQQQKVKLPPSIVLCPKAPSSQEFHLNISYAQDLIKLEMAGDSQEVIWYLFRAWRFRVYEEKKTRRCLSAFFPTVAVLLSSH